MRSISPGRRNRIALRFALAALVAIIFGIVGAILIAPRALAPVLPIAGLAVYVLCAHRAVRLWQNSSSPYPRRRSFPRKPLGAVAIAIIAAGNQAISDLPDTTVPPGAQAAEGSR